MFLINPKNFLFSFTRWSIFRLKVCAIPDGWMSMDIGSEAFNASIDSARTVVYQGSMGLFSFDKFAHGTTAVAMKLSELSAKGATTIVGGGDSIAIMHRLGLANKVSHTSTRGVVSKELLEGKLLPGVVALDDASAY